MKWKKITENKKYETPEINKKKNWWSLKTWKSVSQKCNLEKLTEWKDKTKIKLLLKEEIMELLLFMIQIKKKKN